MVPEPGERGRPAAKPGLLYELAMLPVAVVFLLPALLRAMMGRALGLPLVRFA